MGKTEEDGQNEGGRMIETQIPLLLSFPLPILFLLSLPILSILNAESCGRTNPMASSPGFSASSATSAVRIIVLEDGLE